MTEINIPRIFNKDYLLKILERDGASLSGDYPKLSSMIKIAFICKCGVTTSKKFSFISYYTGAFCPSCIKKIRALKIKETCKEKYHVDNPSQLDHIKQKKEETYLSHYGDHPSRIKEVRDKYKETCIRRYGVDNTSKTKEVKEKIKKIFNEKYDGHPMFNNDIKMKLKSHFLEKYNGFPAQNIEIKEKTKKMLLDKYGCHSSQNPVIFEKIETNSKRVKKFTLPSGRIINIQGYEGYAINHLLKKYNEEQIKNSRKEVPRIKYTYNNKTHYYFPDIYLPHINTIIEVKSDWTYIKDYTINQIKKDATEEAGYHYLFLIFDRHKNILDEETLKTLRLEMPQFF